MEVKGIDLEAKTVSMRKLQILMREDVIYNELNVITNVTLQDLDIIAFVRDCHDHQCMQS